MDAGTCRGDGRDDGDTGTDTGNGNGNDNDNGDEGDHGEREPADRPEPPPAAEHAVVRPAQLARYAAITATVLLVLGIVWMLWTARAVVVSVFLGMFLAAGLEPIVNRVQRFGMRRGLAVTAVILGLVLIGGLFLVLALQPAIKEVADLAETAPNIVETLSSQQNPIGRFIARPDIQRGLQSFLQRLPGMLTSSAGRILGVVGTVAAAVVQAVTVFVLMVYFMLAWPRIISRTERVLAHPARVAVAREALGRVGGYVTGQLSVSLLAGVFAYAFLAIAGVPYAAVLGMIVAFCDLIPQFGAIIGAAVCALVALSQSLVLAAATVAFFFVYQHLENYLVAPRIFAKAVELSPAAVFVAALFGVAVGGFVGAIVALPCAAALKVVVRYALRGRLGNPAGPLPAGAGRPG